MLNFRRFLPAHFQPVSVSLKSISIAPPGREIPANIEGMHSIPSSRSSIKILNSIDLRHATSHWPQLTWQSTCPPYYLVFQSVCHRITECSGLEGTSVGHLVKPQCRSRVTYSRLHRTLSRRVLNISREGDSTTSLGSLFQGSITLRVKKFLLMSINPSKTEQEFQCKYSSFNTVHLPAEAAPSQTPLEVHTDFAVTYWKLVNFIYWELSLDKFGAKIRIQSLQGWNS